MSTYMCMAVVWLKRLLVPISLSFFPLLCSLLFIMACVSNAWPLARLRVPHRKLCSQYHSVSHASIGFRLTGILALKDGPSSTSFAVHRSPPTRLVGHRRTCSATTSPCAAEGPSWSDKDPFGDIVIGVYLAFRASRNPRLHGLKKYPCQIRKARG